MNHDLVLKIVGDIEEKLLFLFKLNFIKVEGG